MSRSPDRFEQDELESLLWDASRYVAATPDLKNRTLHRCRMRRHRRRVGGGIVTAAAATVLMMTAVRHPAVRTGTDRVVRSVLPAAEELPIELLYHGTIAVRGGGDDSKSLTGRFVTLRVQENHLEAAAASTTNRRSRR